MTNRGKISDTKSLKTLPPHGRTTECLLWVFWRIKIAPQRGATVPMTSWHGHAFRFTDAMRGKSAGHCSYAVTTMESLCEYFVEEWAWNKEVRLRMSVSHSSSYHVAPTETTNKTALQLSWRWTVCPCVCPYLYCPWRPVFKFLLEWTVPMCIITYYQKRWTVCKQTASHLLRI